VEGRHFSRAAAVKDVGDAGIGTDSTDIFFNGQTSLGLQLLPQYILIAD
jgi:hypothetical protein